MIGATNAGSGAVVACEPSDVLCERPRGDVEGCRSRCLGAERPLRRRRFLVAAASPMLGYGVMNLLMTATSLAMLDRGLVFGETATVIQWLVLAMFAPPLMTGHLIERFGAVKIIMTGALLQHLCVFVNLQATRLGTSSRLWCYSAPAGASCSWAAPRS